VIAGRRTASGKPLLANDPHRAIQVPSLRSYVHLVAPGWDVIGGGEPAIPGVAIGHNAHGAWGLTIFTLDQEDIVVYALDRADPERYRDGKSWRTFRREADTIRVKGAPPVVVTHRFARHGPVLRVDTARRQAYAIRGTQWDVGAAPYLASLRIDQARTWGEFRQALSFHRMPALNWVWADTGGTIGWQVAGAAPIRRGYSGLLPAPADGRHEWDGRLPVLELPHLANPPLGAFGTANEMNVPAGYAHPEAVSRWWEQWRARRLAEVLGDTTRRFTLGDMTRLQHDEASVAARRLVPLLRGLAPEDPLVRQARDAIVAWDHVMDTASVGAGIYAAWEPRLARDVLGRSVPARAMPELLRWVPTMELDYVVDALESPDARFGARPAAGRDSLLLASFSAAVRSLRERFGDDVASWRLGRPGYKQVSITHPASRVADSALRTRLDVGPAPRGGSGRTLNATGDGDRQRAGASFRIVVDLADWDAALGTNTPGQSGDSRSPHYRDLFAPWAVGRYFAVPYSRRAVMERAEGVTALLPATTP
jgi:penicillin G amidase